MTKLTNIYGILTKNGVEYVGISDRFPPKLMAVKRPTLPIHHRILELRSRGTPPQCIRLARVPRHLGPIICSEIRQSYQNAGIHLIDV